MKFTPQVCCLLSVKRRVVSGMAISPSNRRRLRGRPPPQIPSQLRFTFALINPRACFPLFSNLLFELCAEGRRDEHVAVPGVVEGVEDDLEVVFIEQPVGNPPYPVANTRPSGWLVESVNTNQQVLLSVEHRVISVRSEAARACAAPAA